MRATPYLDPKGRGNKSMVVKRRMSEGCYGMVLQALRNKVKAKLSEASSFQWWKITLGDYTVYNSPPIKYSCYSFA